MSEQTKTMIAELMSSPTSRSHFLTGAAVAAASVGLAPVAASAAGLRGVSGQRATQETPQQILNIAATAEAAAVTALYHVHVAVNQGRLNVSGVAVPASTLVSIVRAALREEQDHLAFLMGAGAKPLYRSFTF